MSSSDSPFNFPFFQGKTKSVNNLPASLNKNRESKRKIEEMMDRMSSIQSSIDEKIENFAQKKGITKEKILSYINTPDNFTPEEWDIMGNEGNQLVRKVWDIVNSGTQGGYVGNSTRKGKHVGAKRNWIPTR